MACWNLYSRIGGGDYGGIMADQGCTVAAVPGSFDIGVFLKGLTSKPGVYRMLDKSGTVIYVGKARNLKKRVRSYFTLADPSPKTRAMIAQIQSIEVTVTHTEKEAFILESNQIKHLRPRYNIWFRDSKSYPYIYLSTEHEFPRLSYHRGARSKKGVYFGPYPNAGAVRKTLKLMKRLFMVRQCKDSFFANRTRPCLEYQIKRCSGPCVALVSRQDYQKDVQHSIMFLEGKDRQVIDSLARPMQAAADALDYERAAHYRDQISNLRKLQEHQYITAAGGNIDLIAVALKDGVACVLLSFIRSGLNQGNQVYFPVNYPVTAAPGGVSDRMPESAVIEVFLGHFYLTGAESGAPDEILLSHKIRSSQSFQELVSARAGHRIRVRCDCRGIRAKWLKMALENADIALAQHLAGKESRHQRIDELRRVLRLETLPRRMECFDISHTGGESVVASCVVFEDGGPLKPDYRKFNIAGIRAGDDYAAMQQAVMRRYARMRKEQGKIPDVILVDGGKGQVGVARKMLERFGVSQPVLIGVAKGPMRKAGLETLIVDDGVREMQLPTHSPALHLLQHIRDEAHRFAIGGHRRQRDKARKRSPLEDIDGVGRKRRQNLLIHFGGLQGVVSAGVDDLAKVDGISKNLAHRIYGVFHQDI